MNLNYCPDCLKPDCECPPVSIKIAALMARAEKAEALAERRRIEREQALNVTTREGLSASEWLMRTAQAEARAEKAEADLEKLRSTDTSTGCAFALCKERDEAVIRAERAEDDHARVTQERDAALVLCRKALNLLRSRGLLGGE